MRHSKPIKAVECSDVELKLNRQSFPIVNKLPLAFWNLTRCVERYKTVNKVTGSYSSSSSRRFLNKVFTHRYAPEFGLFVNVISISSRSKCFWTSTQLIDGELRSKTPVAISSQSYPQDRVEWWQWWEEFSSSLTLGSIFLKPKLITIAQWVILDGKDIWRFLVVK